MNKIKVLTHEDLSKVKEFIDNEKNEFFKFFKKGWAFKNIENHFKKNNNYSVGYFHKNKIFGILIGEKIVQNLDFDLDIHIIFISKDIRGKNIGSNIIDYVKINKKLNRISKIYLEVAENNLEATNFYEKNNFVFFRIRHNYYRENNKIIDAKCYYKII